MNKDQVALIKKLDPNGLDGSIQSLLLRSDLATITFEKALSFLVQALMNDKTTLANENKKLSQILKDHNLYGKLLED